jgi:ribosome modulation factor
MNCDAMRHLWRARDERADQRGEKAGFGGAG